MTNRYLIKKSMAVSGHRTSVALEEEFWNILKAIAAESDLSLTALVARIDAQRTPDRPLSSALRLTCLSAVKKMADTD